jgi:putative flippase GtrA
VQDLSSAPVGSSTGRSAPEIVPSDLRCRTLGVVPAPQQQKRSRTGAPDTRINGHALNVPTTLVNAGEADTRSRVARSRLVGRLLAVRWLRPVGRLVERFEHVIHEVGKFGVVGLFAFLIDFSVFNLLLEPIGPIPAKTVSTVISATLAFVGNRFWTWRHRPRSGYRREYTLYFLFNGVGLGIGLSCLWLSHYGLGSIWPSIFHTRLADNLSSLGMGMILGTTFRFWSYRRIVFRVPATVPSRSPANRDPREM